MLLYNSYHGLHNIYTISKPIYDPEIIFRMFDFYFYSVLLYYKPGHIDNFSRENLED